MVLMKAIREVAEIALRQRAPAGRVVDLGDGLRI